MDVRWNSTYALVEGLLPMETAIMRLFRDDSDFEDVSFDDSVWSQLRAMVMVLQPFAKATVFMQGLTFPTLGVVAQAVDFLVKQMAEFETDLSIGDDGNKLAPHIGASLSRYLPILLNRPATQLSAALHPSVKLSLAKQANGAAALRKDLIAYLRHNSPDVSDPPASPVAQAQRSRTPDFLDLIYKRQGLPSAEDMSPEQQLAHYLAQEPTMSKESPLIFWSTQRPEQAA
ncbi:hypothetical protein OC834_007341 [Tilletia horrida]|uniref:Uncharacterized protein n=1 Tax=Tilletia horrida TaxID=155126 RepID=A0AAN6G677_9BASI|nr:hypothetical protein OC842_007474 [Tilletia horrida]KAK0519551.1 hypothetical protein OC834_007341 [Tilletia horrida]